MKRLARLLLRLLGVALAVFVLTRIQYADQLVYADGRIEKGEVRALDADNVEFLPAEATTPVRLARGLPDSPRVEYGVITTVRGADQWLLVWALLVFGPITLISIFRWWLLLRAIKLPITFRDAVRLSYIGFFFNAVAPGMTGGDLVKAFYVARGSREPYKMFLSVFIDRFIGLFGLALLGAVIVTLLLGEPGFAPIATLVYAVFGSGTLVGCILLSRRLRRWLHVEALLARLPFSRFWQRVDQAVTVYRDAPGTVTTAVLLSIANHGGIILQTYLIGRALGITNPITHYFAVTPLCFLVASVPLLPGGWGMREGAFAYFFAMIGVAAERSVPTSLVLGLTQLAWYLLGGPVFIAQPDRASDRELAAFGAAVEDGTPSA